MDFMDDDFDPDPVKGFLKTKLEEIQSENFKYRETIKELQYQVEKIQNKLQDGSDEISIEKSWVKVVHNKYALWYTIRNKSGKILDNCNLILRWDSSAPLIYTNQLFSIMKSQSVFTPYLKPTEEINEEARLVAVFERPDFSGKLSHEISGIISCRTEASELNLTLPDVIIAVKDSTERQKAISLHQLIETKIPDFASYLACCDRSHFIQRILDPVQSITSNLEINASLYRLDFEGVTGQFFLAHKLSPTFDGCILQLCEERNNEISFVKIYYRDPESLLAFIHHLYQSINSFLLLPKQHQVMFHSKSKEQCRRIFDENVLAEIKLSQEFHKKKNDTGSLLKEYKLKLCDLEWKTDNAFIQLRASENEFEVTML